MKSISFLVILLTILLVCMAADPPSLSNPTKENTSPDPIVDGEHALETVDNKVTEKVNKKKPYKKKTKDWQEMDINAVEKELEDGDDPELLEHEFEVQRRLNDKAMRNRNMGINFNDPKSVAKLLKDPTAAIGASKGMTHYHFILHLLTYLLTYLGPGGAMLFIELNEKQPNGKDWTKLDEDTLSAKLSALMRTGLIHCQLFNIGRDYH